VIEEVKGWRVKKKKFKHRDSVSRVELVKAMDMDGLCFEEWLVGRKKVRGWLITRGDDVVAWGKGKMPKEALNGDYSEYEPFMEWHHEV